MEISEKYVGNIKKFFEKLRYRFRINFGDNFEEEFMEIETNFEGIPTRL